MIIDIGIPVVVGILARYQKCEGCGVLVQNPRLRGDSLVDYYSKGIYRQTSGMDQKTLDDKELFRADIDAQLIHRHVGEKIESHLDIGCSRGYLLDKVSAAFQIGVEPNSDYISSDSLHEAYKSLVDVPGVFSLITCIHALEHEPYPLQYIQEMIDRLDTGGKIVIEVPSNMSQGGPLRFAHLFHWEREAFEKFIKTTGLRIIFQHYTPHLFAIMEIAA
jgi:SAM-dependent methyltransferase